jgi:hypothetical protein
MTKTDNQKASLDLVPWEGCPRPIPAFLTLLPWAGSDADAINDIVAHILQGTTVEEVLTRSDAVELEQMMNVVFTIHGFKMMASDLEEGIGAYAVIDFTYDGGTKHQVTTTSALGILAQLARIWQLGGFPFTCSVTEIDTGKNGKANPRYLCKVEAAETPF